MFVVCYVAVCLFCVVFLLNNCCLSFLFFLVYMMFVFSCCAVCCSCLWSIASRPFLFVCYYIWIMCLVFVVFVAVCLFGVVLLLSNFCFCSLCLLLVNMMFVCSICKQQTRRLYHYSFCSTVWVFHFAQLLVRIFW